MPKLPSLKPRQVVKKLKKLGFIEHHQVGSHLTMKHPVTGHRAVIPLHLKDIKKGLDTGGPLAKSPASEE